MPRTCGCLIRWARSAPCRPRTASPMPSCATACWRATPFRQSDVGKAIDRVSLQNATPLFELCPTALLFGMWDSTGPKGGLGAKFERAMVSEIVGIDAVYGVKTSSRIDPLGIQLKAGPLYAALRRRLDT